MLSQFFCHVCRGGIVVGNYRDSFTVQYSVSNDIKNRLGFTCTGRALNDADLGGESVLHRRYLALIQTKRKKQFLAACQQFRAFLRKVFTKHRLIANALYLAILKAQQVLPLLNDDAHRSGCFFEVVE